MENERAKVKEANFKPNAKKTNVAVNEVAATTRTIGTVFIVAGAVQSTVTIVNSDNPVKETVSETAGWAGSFYVGGQFATATAPMGPVVSTVSGMVGSTVGYFGGKKAGDAVADEVTKPRNWKFPIMPSILFSLF